MTINPSLDAGSMTLQLQRMQQQMRMLQEAANAQNTNINPGAEFKAQLEAIGAQSTPQTAQDSVGTFAGMLSSAIESVNTLQNQSGEMQTKFDLGDRSVTLADVMLMSQKSRIAFEATSQIRSRVVEAYRTISQMQL